MEYLMYKISENYLLSVTYTEHFLRFNSVRMSQKECQFPNTQYKMWFVTQEGNNTEIKTFYVLLYGLLKEVSF